MIDIQFIRDNATLVKEISQKKNVKVDIDELLAVDEDRRALQTSIDELNRQKNELSKMAPGNKPTPEVIEEGRKIKEEISTLQERYREATATWEKLMDVVPNIPTPDTPSGKNESENKVLRTIGDKTSFDFEPKPHWELGSALDLIDNERASKVSGSRFTYLKREAALLEFALINFALGIVTDEKKLTEIAGKANLSVASKPFIPVVPPSLISRESLRRMARLNPEEERYFIPSDDMFLVGSAEHTMGAMHMDETLQEKDLPLRYVGFSPSFRREAGSHGKDVRGILRLHQFDKVEMESFTIPEHSVVEQDFLVAIQEYFMQQLGLPYQVIIKCTGDMGGPDARAIDIETWMPGQDTYRETHTADLMTDYQARRLNTKVNYQGKKVFAHMNDATLTAVGRTIIAILENYQQADGSVVIPAALHPYLPFTSIPAAR